MRVLSSSRGRASKTATSPCGAWERVNSAMEAWATGQDGVVESGMSRNRVIELF